MTAAMLHPSSSPPSKIIILMVTVRGLSQAAGLPALVAMGIGNYYAEIYKVETYRLSYKIRACCSTFLAES